MTRVWHIDQREQVVGSLEALIEKAKRGEVNAVAFAFTTPALDIGHGWCAVPGSSMGLLLGAVSYLRHRLESEAVAGMAHEHDDTPA